MKMVTHQDKRMNPYAKGVGAEIQIVFHNAPNTRHWEAEPFFVNTSNCYVVREFIA
jgi:hypothetical protein